MPSIEEISFKNIITVKLINGQSGEIIKTVSQPNTVTTLGKNLILDILGGNNNIISHGAIGTSSGLTSTGSTLLKSELARTTLVYNRVGQTGTFSVFFNTGQGNSTITEVGFFGGTSSFTSTNTGVMMNRILLSSPVTKTNAYALTIDLDMSIT